MYVLLIRLSLDTLQSDLHELKTGLSKNDKSLQQAAEDLKEQMLVFIEVSSSPFSIWSLSVHLYFVLL